MTHQQEILDPTPRGEAGRFLPGQAPKSPGRPRGPSAADQIRTLIEPHKAEIIAKAVELAKAGDPASLRLCLERLAPVPRPEAEKVVVPGLREAPTLQAKATAILAAVADGQISAEAGDKLLRMLDTYGKAVVLDEHERRLQAIEGRRRSAAPPSPPDDGADLV
ncbi:hypothetical protein [Cupriavidus metallidurans]|uniref:hypothetical protein n=1 Tax=Cupriavidus metallidurans TaxID=119219 RepID=UPI0007636433|nr:hypothetical protein [Cupriavidus metallidurans]KWW37669.1 hypothetical protein AU374_01436 [Cupriavidus metallidurans]